MNVEHLKLFIRIAALNNISLAGKELGLSPAVSSAHINKLENSLGVKLIYRTTRKVSLTQEGKAFLPHAEEVITSIDLAKSSVGVGSVAPQGTIRIAAPASFGRMHLTPALTNFIKRYSDLKVDLKLSDSVIDMVEGGFDVAIRNAALNDSSLVARKLANDKRVVCASPSYIAEYGQPKTPQSLQEHQCIHLSGTESWSFKTQQGNVKPNGQVVFQADNGESIRDACINGVGLTVCSVWCAYKNLINGQLVQVLKEYPLVSETAIWAVYPSSRLLAPKVRCFIDYMLEYFGQTPYWEAELREFERESKSLIN